MMKVLLASLFLFIDIVYVQTYGDTGNIHSVAEASYQQLETILAAHPNLYGYRVGNASASHSCSYVRGVPETLRHQWVMKPSGIDPFYEKYTEAYGIPVVASKNVTDDALKRACYVLRFLLADHSGMRQSYYKLFGRVAVIGANEEVTGLPEYSFLKPEWNERSRGFGATEVVPTSSGAEENLLCDSERDRYRDEDIFLHELSHGLHLLGATHAIPGWQEDLERAYDNAKTKGLWQGTYSMSTVGEYLAEGVQSYFGTNAYRTQPDGVHGPVDTPHKLLEYDPDLYKLIDLLFPCHNIYFKRCLVGRGREARQVLQMNCDLTSDYQAKIPKYIPDGCLDENFYCPDWAERGECQINPSYMQLFCRKSCHWCAKSPSGESSPPAETSCPDTNQHCATWAGKGECERNPGYMLQQCQRSCQTC